MITNKSIISNLIKIDKHSYKLEIFIKCSMINKNKEQADKESEKMIDNIEEVLMKYEE